tara:strand:+ start:4002 stop:4238 length:237 start_codon:yes stop_codon:yes gene_type:complete
MKNSQFLCFNEWVGQLIYNKTKVFWIDKNNTKHYLWSKKPTLDDSGNVDYKKLSVRNKEMEIKTYRWICNNMVELLNK